MLTKRFNAEVKARKPEEGGQRGEFEAIVAVYDNVDSVGDRIKSSAFDETLAAWRKSGDPIPVVLAHNWDDPYMHIGYAMPEDVKSVPGRGLYVQKAVLDVDDNPIAKQVHRLMERRTLKEFSFGYRVPEGGERKAEDGAYDLTRLDLIEFGPCLKGVNDDTELLAVKAELKAEARRKTGDEPTLEERLTRIEATLAELTKGRDEEEEPAPEDDPHAKLDVGVVVTEGDPEPAKEEAEPEDDAEEIVETKSADIELAIFQAGLDNLEAALPDVFKADRSVDEATRLIEAGEAGLDT